MKPASGVLGRADTHSGLQGWPAPRISVPGGCETRFRRERDRLERSVGHARAHAACFRPLSFPVLCSGRPRVQPTPKARRTVLTDERMSLPTRPFKIARLTGEMPRSAVFGSNALITLIVLHAQPVLARINVVGFAECSHET